MILMFVWALPNITLANCNAYFGTSTNKNYNGGYAGLASDGKTQCRCATGKKWDGNACIPSQHASCTSWTTNECGAGYYCQFWARDKQWYFHPPEKGECQPVYFCDITELGTIGVMAHAEYGSCSLNFWSAQSFCISQNMHLISFADLKCEKSECLASSRLYQKLVSTDWNFGSWTSDYIGEKPNKEPSCHYLNGGAIDPRGCWDDSASICIK